MGLHSWLMRLLLRNPWVTARGGSRNPVGLARSEVHSPVRMTSRTPHRISERARLSSRQSRRRSRCRCRRLTWGFTVRLHICCPPNKGDADGAIQVNNLPRNQNLRVVGALLRRYLQVVEDCDQTN
jgi:hypothetical protein